MGDIRLSEKDIDGEEYLPNPYQAEAEAQVRAGAWPGALLLNKNPYVPSAPNSPTAQVVLPGQRNTGVSELQEANNSVDPHAVAALLMASPPDSPQHASPVTSPFGSFVAKPAWPPTQAFLPVACVVGCAVTSPSGGPSSPFSGLIHSPVMPSSPVIASPVMPSSPMGSYVARPIMPAVGHSVSPPASVKGSVGGSSSRPGSGSPCSVGGRRRRRLGSVQSTHPGDAFREVPPDAVINNRKGSAADTAHHAAAKAAALHSAQLQAEAASKLQAEVEAKRKAEAAEAAAALHSAQMQAEAAAKLQAEAASKRKAEAEAAAHAANVRRELDELVKEQPVDRAENDDSQQLSLQCSERKRSPEVADAPWSFLPEFRANGLPSTSSRSPRRSGYESHDSSDEGDVDADAAPDSTDCDSPGTSPSPPDSIDDAMSGPPVVRKRLGSMTSLMARARDSAAQVLQSEPENPTDPNDPNDPNDPSLGDQSLPPGSTRKLSHLHVPKSTDLTKKFGKNGEETEITTLMVRNIPNLYTRTMLIEELDSLGFRGEFNFIYLPIDKSTEWNVGYAFVNFVDSNVAAQFAKIMTNYKFCQFDHGSGKVAQVSIAHIQGLQKNLEHYSNTAVQCARVQSHRPLVLAGGSKDKSRRSPQKRRSGRNRHQPRLAQVAQDSSDKQLLGPSDAQRWDLQAQNFYAIDAQMGPLPLQVGMPYGQPFGTSASMDGMGSFGFVPYEDNCSWFHALHGLQAPETTKPPFAGGCTRAPKQR